MTFNRNVRLLSAADRQGSTAAGQRERSFQHRSWRIQFYSSFDEMDEIVCRIPLVCATLDVHKRPKSEPPI